MEKTERKETKKQIFEALAEYFMEDGHEVDGITTDLVQFFKAEAARVARPVNRKPTATQIQNGKEAERVAEILADADEPMSIPQIQAADEMFAGATNQHMNQLLVKLGAQVQRSKVKGVTYYALAADAE